jgi:hypothetical protein
MLNEEGNSKVKQNNGITTLLYFGHLNKQKILEEKTKFKLKGFKFLKYLPDKEKALMQKSFNN